MKLGKILLLFVFVFVMFSVNALDLLLNSGKEYKDVEIVSKDQFGINILDHVRPSGVKVLRHIRFYDISTLSLKNFPYTDGKTIARLVSALNDRATIAKRKYLEAREKDDNGGDFAVNTNIPGGVNLLRVLFIAEENTENATIGWAHSDTPEAVMYGKIYIFGILIEPGQVWLSEIYPGLRTIEHNGNTYQLFTFHKNSRINEAEENEAHHDDGSSSKDESGSK